MLRRRLEKFNSVLYRKKAQSIAEYSVVIGVVALTLITMRVMIKRGAQGMIRTVADQIGHQNESEQLVTKETGRLLNSYTSSRSKKIKTLDELHGDFAYVYDDLTESNSYTHTNMGQHSL